MNNPIDIVKGVKYKSNMEALHGTVYLGCQYYRGNRKKHLIIIRNDSDPFFIGTIIPNVINNPIWEAGFTEIN